MHPRLLRSLALVCVSSLVWTGCAPLSSGEREGPFSGENAQLAAANINRATTANTGERFATGASIATSTTGGVVTIIAKHQASVRQREIAQQRAMAAYRKILAREEGAGGGEAPEPEPKKRKPHVKKHAEGQGQEAKPKPRGADVRKPKPHKGPRYIAVDTVKDSKSAPGTKKAVMLWDTQTQEIVGNNVYDIGNPPKVGSTSRFETFSAEYVGAGL